MTEVYSGPDPARAPCTNTAKLERALAELPAPEAHFVAMDESSLLQFADAYPRVRNIQAVYDPLINRARDQGEALRLQQQADAEMAKAIEAADLEVVEYNRVAVRVSKNEELRARVRALMEHREGFNPPSTTP